MANPKWTKTEIQAVTITDDAVIRIKKRKTPHKPFVITANYPEYNTGSYIVKAYKKNYRFAKLQGALDSMKTEFIGWKAKYNMLATPEFILTNADTQENLTHLLGIA